jgi:type IV pilus assembly protein PilA
MVSSDKQQRAHHADDGFTLIELMVVVMIIAILIAIAIPSFLGAQDRARDRRVQSDLRNALTVARIIAVDHDGLFVTATNPAVPIVEADLTAGDGALTFADGAPTTSGPIDAVAAADGSTIVLYSKSVSGSFFCIKATSNGTVTFGQGTAAADVDGSAATECAAARF